MTIELRSIPLGPKVGPFLAAGRAVLRDDPAWVAPLDFEIRDRLHPRKNPFFEHGEAALWVAYRDGRPVGRISASVDQEWQKRWNDRTGHFGFFDTVDDVEVARALIEAAEGWLRERGVDRVLGPMSLGANEEIGILVDGFEHPPSLMMAHSRTWQAGLTEACGYTKEKDLFCWRFDESTPLTKRALKAWEDVRALPELTLRSMDMKRLHQELAVIVDIYNEAWSEKWGFVPITQREVEKMAEDMKLVLDPDIAFVAELNGEPVAMCVMVPNLNEAVADLDGSLFPLGWAKLLWRVKVKHPGSTRLILLGIREQVRKNVKRYGALSAAMYVEVAKRATAKGYRWSELGWTREDDAPINLGIKAMGGRVYKRYRVYGRTL
jgi:GNAT superfamily N-acetyltransferase